MSNIPAKNGSDQVFQLAAITLPDGSQAQAIVLVDSAGNLVPAAESNAAALTSILQALQAQAKVTDQQLVTGTVDVGNLPTDPATNETLAAVRDRLPAAGTASEAKLIEVLAKLNELLTELQSKADAAEAQNVAQSDIDFISRTALKALARLTHSAYGLRVDAGQTALSLSTTTGLTGLGVMPVANGNNTLQGQGVQQSNIAFQTSFRRNLVQT